VKFITGDYKSREGSVTKMLAELELESLQSRRTSQRLIRLYKVVEGLVPAVVKGSHTIAPYSMVDKEMYAVFLQSFGLLRKPSVELAFLVTLVMDLNFTLVEDLEPI
jgi:hypothetical protein